jgi:phage terminase small subunit
MRQKMTEKSGKLTSKKRKAIAALIGGATVTEAADKAGVKRQTVHTWLNEKGFKTELKISEAKVLDEVSRKLVALADKAVSAFKDVLDNSEADISLRVQAADKLIRRLIELRTQVDLEERVSELEKMAKIGK